MIVPGGALTKDNEWVSSKRNYLVPYGCVEKIFKGMLIRRIKEAFPDYIVPNKAFENKWVIKIKSAVDHIDSVIKYLSGYVNKIAISNKKILKLENEKVTFEFKRNKDNTNSVMTLPVLEFMRRYLTHVLPSGFVRIRYYGILHQSQKKKLIRAQEINNVMEEKRDEINIDDWIEITKKDKKEIKCKCGNTEIITYIVLPSFAYY